MITWGSACDPCESGQSQAQAFDEIIRKRHFLSPEATEPGECRPGAAGTISATTEESLTEKVAYTEAEEPNIGLGQIPDGIFEHLDQAMSEAISTPRLSYGNNKFTFKKFWFECLSLNHYKYGQTLCTEISELEMSDGCIAKLASQ